MLQRKSREKTHLQSCAVFIEKISPGSGPCVIHRSTVASVRVHGYMDQRGTDGAARNGQVLYTL